MYRGAMYRTLYIGPLYLGVREVREVRGEVVRAGRGEGRA